MAKNNIHKGTINNAIRTDKQFQVRKHVKQMTDNEKLFCASLLRGIKKLDRSPHLKKKNITFNSKSIITTLNGKDLSQNIIEYNEKYDILNDRWTQRCLIHIPFITEFKDENNIKHKGNLKAVIDITTKQVITVYYNKEEDNHSTINLDNYQKDLVIRDFKSGGYKSINDGLSENLKARIRHYIINFKNKK